MKYRLKKSCIVVDAFLFGVDPYPKWFQEMTNDGRIKVNMSQFCRWETEPLIWPPRLKCIIMRPFPQTRPVAIAGDSYLAISSAGKVHVLNKEKFLGMAEKVDDSTIQSRKEESNENRLHQ